MPEGPRDESIDKNIVFLHRLKRLLFNLLWVKVGQGWLEGIEIELS